MARAESTQDRGAARLAAGPEIISGPAAAGASPKQRSARRKRIELTILLGPPLILFIGFVFVPMIFAIWYSLYNWNGYGPLSDFIGLQNYQGVVTGSVFHQAPHRAVHAPRPVHLRVRAALSRRRAGRRDQGLSRTQCDAPGHGHPAAGRGTGPVPRPAGNRYRPAPLGTRCGAPKAASRRSCWSSV